MDVYGSRSATINYEGGDPQFGSRISQITDPGGSNFVLQYQGRSLSSVTFASGPGSPTYSFEYYPKDDPASGARLEQLSRFRTPRAQAGGHFWSCQYHPN